MSGLPFVSYGTLHKESHTLLGRTKVSERLHEDSQCAGFALNQLTGAQQTLASENVWYTSKCSMSNQV